MVLVFLLNDLGFASGHDALAPHYISGLREDDDNGAAVLDARASRVKQEMRAAASGALAEKIRAKLHEKNIPVTSEELEEIVSDNVRSGGLRQAGSGEYTPSPQELGLMDSLGFELADKQGRVRYKRDYKPPELGVDLWYMTHGATDGNKAALLQGSRSDGEQRFYLNEEGHKQAKEGAEKLWNILGVRLMTGEKIVFLTSPISRARQTADHFIKFVEIKSEGKLNIELVPLEILKEVDHGFWDGKKREELPEDEKILAGQNYARNVFVKSQILPGENFLEFIKRVRTAVEFINREYKGKTVIIFGHGFYSAAIKIVLKTQEVDQIIAEKGYIDWSKPLQPHTHERCQPIHFAATAGERKATSGDEIEQFKPVELSPQNIERETPRQLDGLPANTAMLLRVIPKTPQEAQECKDLVELNIGLRPLMTYEGLLKIYTQEALAHRISKGEGSLTILLPFRLKVPGLKGLSELKAVLGIEKTWGMLPDEFQSDFNLLGTRRDTVEVRRRLLTEAFKLLSAGELRLENIAGFPIGLPEKADKEYFANEMKLDPNRLFSETEANEISSRLAAAKAEQEAEKLQEKLQKERDRDAALAAARLDPIIQKAKADLNSMLDELASSSVPPAPDEVEALRGDIAKLSDAEPLDRGNFQQAGASLKGRPDGLRRRIKKLEEKYREEREITDLLLRIIYLIDAKDWPKFLAQDVPNAFSSNILGEYPKLSDRTVERLNQIVHSIHQALHSQHFDDPIIYSTLRTIQAMIVNALAAAGRISESAAQVFCEDNLSTQGDVWVRQRNIWSERLKRRLERGGLVKGGLPPPPPQSILKAMGARGKTGEIASRCLGVFDLLILSSRREQFSEPAARDITLGPFTALYCSMLRIEKADNGAIAGVSDYLKSLYLRVGEVPADIKKGVLLGKAAYLVNLGMVEVSLASMASDHFGAKDFAAEFMDVARGISKWLPKKYPEYKPWYPPLLAAYLNEPGRPAPEAQAGGQTAPTTSDRKSTSGIRQGLAAGPAVRAAMSGREKKEARGANIPQSLSGKMALRKTLLTLVSKELQKGPVVIATDTELVPIEIAQMAEKVTKRYLGGSVMHIRGAGEKLLEAIRAKGLNPKDVVIIAGDNTAGEARKLGTVIHVKNPEGEFLPILIELYDLALKILYGLGEEKILESLKGISADRCDEADVKRLLIEGIIRILPKTIKISGAEKLEAYSATQAALQSL